MQNALIDDDAAAAAAAMNALRQAEAERAGATPIEVQRERYRILQRYAQPQTTGAMYATRYMGPRPNRPVVNGRAVVSAEELADFRRQFGMDKTLRDLLNADRMGVPTVPSAMDPRARGMQGANVAPGMPAAAAGPAAMPNGLSEFERNALNAMNALAPVLPVLPVVSRAMLASRLGRAAPVARVEPYMPDAAPVMLRQVPRPVVLD